MNHQPLQILVHKSDILISKDKEVLVDLAYVVVDMLAGVSSLPEVWSLLRRRAEGVTKSSTTRGITQFRLAYQSAVTEYKALKGVKVEEPQVVSKDYSGRQLSFEYRIANPSYFVRDTSITSVKEVETAEKRTIIEEDSSFYQGRENEFQHRLRDPSRFRRCD
jgi:hypothetical protein